MNTITSGPQHASSVFEVASIVHDLRNPLTAIHGGAELLVGSRLSQPQIHRIARNMYGASLRMKELLDEILNRWASREREAEFCDLRDLIASAVDKIAVIAESQSVRIVQNLPDRLVIAVERHRMQSVVVNLLVNALEAMPTGGTIDISAVCDEYSVVVHVCDSGPGIAPEIRQRLFQPFATAGKTNGFGLGLALSRQAVIDRGGEMWAESSSHQGACFAFRLPRTIPQQRSGLMLMPLALAGGESAEPPGTTRVALPRAQRSRQFS
jgi:two-component system, NtrC family, sensor histidine kinase HydH